MKKAKIKLSEFELYLGENFNRATIHNPLVKKTYELVKTERVYDGKTTYGLSLRILRD